MLRFFVRSGRAARSAIRALAGERTGVSAIEFAIISPFLLAIGIGMLKFGVAMQQYLLVTNAAAQGAMTMGMARGMTVTSSPAAGPYTSTTSAITTAAPGLTSGSITTTVKINGTACSSDSTCASSLVAGATVTVKVAYPCDLTVMGINFKSGCTLSSTSGQIVQ